MNIRRFSPLQVTSRDDFRRSAKQCLQLNLSLKIIEHKLRVFFSLGGKRLERERESTALYYSSYHYFVVRCFLGIPFNLFV